MHFNKIILALAAAGFATGAYATNVMNLEGYGPIATGMGGASFAYDNGTAGVMNNPATLGLMGQGSRLDVAIGFLGPNVDVDWVGASASSGGDAYWMPAIGYIRKSGPLTYGVAVFGQGGMGTEYPAGELGTGFPEMRSEVSVGRLIFPLAYDVSPNLSIGASLDFVWAGMDIKMMTPTGQYIDFSNDNDFTGKATGTGFAGKIGAVYKVNDKFSIGGTYHTQTNLNDLKGDGTFSFDGGEGMVTVPATYKVVDFQWPETYGVGIAFQATPKLMIAADIKQVNWSDVMKDFKLSINGNVASMPQNWDDQTVYQIGLAYKTTDALTLRAGYNYGENPIKDDFLNPLFPAIVESHWTAGFGYTFSPVSELNFSFQYAPEVDQTNQAMFPDGFGGALPGTVSHSQTSFQLMYSHKF